MHKITWSDAFSVGNESIDFSDIDTNLHLTVSIGIADTQEIGTFDFHHLFKRADTRLYQAKKAGRSRLVA